MGRCPTQPEPPLFVLVLVYLYFFVYFCVSVSLCLVVNGEVWPVGHLFFLPAHNRNILKTTNDNKEQMTFCLEAGPTIVGFQDLTFIISIPKM